jgi:hypothetical protein
MNYRPRVSSVETGERHGFKRTPIYELESATWERVLTSWAVYLFLGRRSRVREGYHLHLLRGPEDQLARCVAVPVIGLPFQREMAMGIVALVLAQREGGNERPPTTMMKLK